jgi:hypothetical protein
VNAYTLEGRFESDPRRMFWVEGEVRRWAAEGRLGWTMYLRDDRWLSTSRRRAHLRPSQGSLPVQRVHPSIMDGFALRVFIDSGERV